MPHLTGSREQVQLDIRIGQTIVVHWLQALEREEQKAGVRITVGWMLGRHGGLTEPILFSWDFAGP